MRITILSIVILAYAYSASAQFDSQLPKPDRYVPSEVVDSVFGIVLYERLNMRLSWDSIRNCKGYACTGWVKDYYINGRIMHKGYYVDGQLKIYSNYFPDGTNERIFRIIDDTKSEMKVFYPSGKLKSKVRYLDSEPLKWEDYYENGQLSYIEEYHKSLSFHLIKSSYFDDGSPRAELILESKKERVFNRKEYYDNKKMKLRGQLRYNKNLLDYEKIGTWEYYNDSGQITRAEQYENGKISQEKQY